ncbi:MAG: O-antigen ligase family protein [Burkholderiales bacterium]
MKNWLVPVPFLLLLFVLPFPGTVALRLLCLLAAFLIAAVTWKKLAPPTLPHKSLFALWIGFALASLLYAVDPSYSLGEIKNEIGYTMMALFAFLAFFDERRKVVWGAWAIAASLAVISVWGLWSWSQLGLWKEDGGHGGSGTYAGLVLMALPALVLIWSWQPKWRWLVAGIGLVALLAAAYSRQRAFWPALGVELGLLIFLLHFRKTNALSGRRVLGSLALILAAGAIFIGATQGARFGLHGGAVEMGNDPRLQNWPAVVARIGEQPWVGAGFGRNAMKLGHPDLLPPAAPLFWHAHNLFLNYALALGVPGMLALVVLFAGLFLVYWRMYRSEHPDVAVIGIAGMLLFFAVISRNLSNDFFQRDVALLFWSMNGLLLGYAIRASGSRMVSRPVA